MTRTLPGLKASKQEFSDETLKNKTAVSLYMPLFTHNVNNEVLVSIEYAKVLSSAGFAIESILTSLSIQKFGKVSRIAKEVVERTKQENLDDALKNATAYVSQKNLKTFFLSLAPGSGANLVRTLSALSDHIIQERSLSVESLIDSMKANLNRLMLIMAAPLFIFFVEMFKDAIVQGGEDFPFHINIPGEINYVIIGLDVLALGIVLYLLRYKE